MILYGILPVVGILIFLDHQSLICIHAQTGELGQLYKAVDETEIIGVVDVIENAPIHIVIDADALFRNHGVVADGIHIQAGARSKGSRG